VNPLARSVPRFLYNALLFPLGAAGAYCLKPFNEKLGRTLGARKGARARWTEKAKSLRASPVWFHVSSVGEYEQARPVIAALNERSPEIPVAVTFLSPSGYGYAMKKETLDGSNNIKFMEYLPLDSPGNSRFCLALLKPRALIFVKFDLWPNLIWSAHDAGIPVILIDGTLSGSSYRFSRIGRLFYRAVYRDLDAILAISHADAERFRASAPGHAKILVAGDTRFDRVAQRKRHAADIPIQTAGRTVFVAGSLWPEDEPCIMPALERLLGEMDGLTLVIAPHEPSREYVAHFETWARERRLDAARLSQIESGSTARCIVVDSVGILAELYRMADMAYVGGGFSTGVHSVIEPAIMGIPVLFGPAHANSFEALELVRRGGGIALSGESEAYGAIHSLLDDPAKRAVVGARAKEYVDSQLGATDACWNQLSPFIEGRTSP
jgi:3-deoxy-D-manno-octulosonic-acid transferase